MNRVIGILVAVILVTGCDWGVNEHQERQNSADVQQEGIPFVLIARLHSLPGKANELIKLSRAVDRKVEQCEPGMLLHTFDQDPDDPLGLYGPRSMQAARPLNTTCKILTLFSILRRRHLSPTALPLRFMAASPTPRGQQRRPQVFLLGISKLRQDT